jgi:hypothetical protein
LKNFIPKARATIRQMRPLRWPIFPYNRCDVYACKTCQCAVLKYTEYGGYYVDHRVRLVDAGNVIDRTIIDPLT